MNKKTPGIVLLVIVVIAVVGLILYRGKTHSSEPTISDVHETVTNNSASSHEPITIHATLSLTGAPLWGRAAESGINTAIKEINDNGGINGRPLVLVTEDTKGTKPDAIVASIKSDTLTIYPDSDIEAIQNGKRLANTFSTWGRLEPKADRALEYFSKHAVKKLFLLTDNPTFATILKAKAAQHGVEIIGSGTDVIQAKSAKAGAVFMDLRDEENVIPQGADGFYLSLPRKLNTKDPMEVVGTSYDAIYMIARATKDQPADLGRYMRGVNFKTTGFGNITFDELGGITTPENYYVVLQVKGGKAVEVK